MTRIIICGAILAMCSTTALAYRPFDGTDANVANPGELELELGYLGYLREGQSNSVIAPAAVINIGLEEDRELILEGRVKTQLRDQADTRRTVLDNVAFSFKQVHRSGVLQDRAGPSIASECGVLLPSLQGEKIGATCDAILSQRWSAATVHFNVALTRNREGNWEQFAGGIFEGGTIGKMKPVLELFTDHISAGARTNSALAGLIWQTNDRLSFDFGLRTARSGAQGINEIRAGLTWSFPVNSAQ